MLLMKESVLLKKQHNLVCSTFKLPASTKLF